MIDWQLEAQKSLKILWGAQVSCTISDTLRDEGRNRAYRLAVTGGPVSSVILKASLGDETNPYMGRDDAPGKPFRRFCNEWAGCALLAPLGLGPADFTGNIDLGFFIMQDLGAGISLADRLIGNDPELATAALLAYAHSLGELHAATVGFDSRWNELRITRGGKNRQPSAADSWIREFTAFTKICEQFGVAHPRGIAPDLARIADAADNPGDYNAFSPTDCCPDNHYLRGHRVIFFDCEGARMRHALLDTAYFSVPFPTCWCASKLPDKMPARMLSAYREHFPGQANFDDQLTLMRAAWILANLVRGLAGDPDKPDQQWGLVSTRQRHVHHLENLLGSPTLATLLPSLAMTLERLFDALRTRWADLPPMPYYPAFKTPVSIQS
jgi:hypothetical protein